MNKLERIYELLLANYKKQEWWPIFFGKNKRGKQFEICVGAILTQNTAWKNVEKALKNLHDSSLLSSKAIISADVGEIAQKIKPSGYFNQKAKKLKLFAEFFAKEFEQLEKSDLMEARARLLELHGIGKETADSMLLYALNRPIFVIDAYTKRVFSRLFDLTLDEYDEWQEFFHKNLTHMKNKEEMFNEYHALIVEHAKRFCKKKEECEKCFLNRECFAAKKV